VRELLVALVLTSASFAQLNYERPVDWNLPASARTRLQAAHIFEKYRLSDRINPFYLRGDLDGDGTADYAIVLVENKSKKTEIAVCLSTKKGVEILGANGVSIRVGSKSDGYDLEDFDWMDAWQVHRKMTLTPSDFNAASTITRMSGEGLMVEKTESASAVIYWDGVKFRWYQLSD
jgi:hypothetical protein